MKTVRREDESACTSGKARVLRTRGSPLYPLTSEGPKWHGQGHSGLRAGGKGERAALRESEQSIHLNRPGAAGRTGMAAAPGTWGAGDRLASLGPQACAPPLPHSPNCMRHGWRLFASEGGRSTYHGPGEGAQVGRLPVVGEPVVLVEGHSILWGQSQSQCGRGRRGGAGWSPSRPVHPAFPQTGPTCAAQEHHPRMGTSTLSHLCTRARPCCPAQTSACSVH